MISKLINSFEKVAAAKPLTSAELSRRYPGIVGDSIRTRNRVRAAFPETLKEHFEMNEIPSDAFKHVSFERLLKPLTDDLIRHPGQEVTNDVALFGKLNTAHLPRRVLGVYFNKLRRLNKIMGSQVVENPRALPLLVRRDFRQDLPEDVSRKDRSDMDDIASTSTKMDDIKYVFDLYRSGARFGHTKQLKSLGLPTKSTGSPREEFSDVSAPRYSFSKTPGRIPAEKADKAEQNKPDWGYRVYGDNG